MTERKTVVYPNPQVLAEAVAARTLLTIIDLLMVCRLRGRSQIVNVWISP